MHHIPWDIIVTVVISVLGSGGLWSFIQHRLEKRDMRKSALEQGVIALLHDRIYKASKEYLERGSVTVQELDNLEYLYQPYKEMGGNGTGEQLYKDVKTLPKK